MTEKKGFVLYFDAASSLAALCAAQRGELLLALFDYAERTAKQSLSPEAALASTRRSTNRRAWRSASWQTASSATQRSGRRQRERPQSAARCYARARGGRKPRAVCAGRNDWMKDYTL